MVKSTMGDDTEDRPAPFNMTGQWILHKSENYGQFLEEIGVNMIGRQIATKAKPTIDIEQDGNFIKIETITGPFVPDEVFSVGKAAVIIEPCGRKIKLTPQWSEKGLVVHFVPQTGSKQVPYTVTRTLTIEDSLITTLESGDVVAKRVFKRVEPQGK